MSETNEITGTGDSETLRGSEARDRILGLEGDDYLIGGGGPDEIQGGSGNDTIEVDDAAGGSVINGGDGTDEFSFYAFGNVTIDLATGELTTGTASDGMVLLGMENVWGGFGDETIKGDAGANRLRGDDGADWLEGAAGADTLEGGNGGDRLAGGDGDDTLDGGADDDTLSGGDGVDVAAFSGNRADYVVTYHYDGSGVPAYATVADQVIGRDGTDTILFDEDGAVEQLRFDDGDVAVTCFMPGTLIATPTGEAPVESLGRGDLVTTADGRVAPIVWMGRQTVSRRFADPVRVLPIRIRAGALGAGLPQRELLLSPDHALFLDGVLVHAGALVNGSTIRRETDVPERWTYWHVELADHALVLAEGVAAESFVDNAERMNFDNWAEHQAHHPQGCAIEEMPLPRAKSRRQVPLGLRRRIAALAGPAVAA